eukprot:746016-Hanusia_phi.AAC.1
MTENRNLRSSLTKLHVVLSLDLLRPGCEGFAGGARSRAGADEGAGGGDDCHFRPRETCYGGVAQDERSKIMFNLPSRCDSQISGAGCLEGAVRRQRRSLHPQGREGGER